MKTKILGGIAIFSTVAVAVVALNLNPKSNNLSGIALENKEALAEQDDEFLTPCPQKEGQCPIKVGNIALVISGWHAQATSPTKPALQQ